MWPSPKIDSLLALSLAEQWALKSAIKKFRSAINDRERDAARKEVLEATADQFRAASRDRQIWTARVDQMGA